MKQQDHGKQCDEHQALNNEKVVPPVMKIKSFHGA
jgi:hypothetical protein